MPDQQHDHDHDAEQAQPAVQAVQPLVGRVRRAFEHLHTLADEMGEDFGAPALEPAQREQNIRERLLDHLELGLDAIDAGLADDGTPGNIADLASAYRALEPTPQPAPLAELVAPPAAPADAAFIESAAAAAWHAVADEGGSTISSDAVANAVRTKLAQP